MNGICQNCGHAFVNALDIEFGYMYPPRHPQDWERLHARNMFLACSACTQAKGDKPFTVWLDEQGAARMSQPDPEEADESQTNPSH